MNGSELFDLWTPLDSVWSRWAKPVLFAEPLIVPSPSVSPAPSTISAPAAPVDVAAPSPLTLSSFPASGTMAVVVDLLGARSVEAGLLLVDDGYRPVPLFNGAAQAGALVDVGPVIQALEAGAGKVAPGSLGPQAPPAFLLDARRQSPKGTAAPGSYDNRWLVFPQDFPSATFLRSRQVTRVLLLQEAGQTQPAEDLAHVLRRWQEAGLELLLAHPGQGVSPISLQVDKPSRFRALSYRAMALFGLHRNSAGGFGSRIPLLPTGGGGGGGLGFG